MKAKVLMPLWAGLFFFSLVLAVVQALSLALGATSISIPEVLSVLAGEGSEHARRVVWELRLPRALLAVLVGMHLAVSGYLLQTLSRNPLADAGVLGISAGASLAAVLMVVAGTFLPVAAGLYWQGDQLLNWLPLGACAGGFLAALLVYTLSGGSRLTPLRMILTGVICAAILNALVTGVLALWGQAHMETLVSWLAGSLHGRSWQHLEVIMPWSLSGLLGAILVLKPLSLLRLNDEQVLGLGLNLERWRAVILLLATLLAASAVAVAGPIGFVGLVVPHMARRLVAGSLPGQLMVAAVVGSLLVSLADLAGRVLVQPFELPVGVLCALLGVPAFLYLLRRQPG
ncbi:FecCD family ABC transporter permease [Marinobacterium stanieri]|uniref:FecCD family ABC transporter permease n=1 Tax=Marinobacterium stanieri TaxID=49186 RepID=UPI0002558408|nr:iron ABC transporter permease [Marinobacterium stanieri]